MGGHLLPPDSGTGVTDNAGRKRLVEIRVPKDGTKLDLYDTDSKTVRKDQTDVPAYADGN